MLLCPHCQQSLDKHPLPQGVGWACRRCGGLAVNSAVLRKTIPGQLYGQLWMGTFPGSGRQRNCPSCHQPMREVGAPAGPGTLLVDVCKRCQLFWFDWGEFDAMPRRPRPQPAPDPEKNLPLEARQQLAIAKVKAMAEEAAREPLELDATDWRILPGLLGLPVEADAPVVSRFPWATAGLAVAIVLAFLASLHAGLKESIEGWGFIPDAMFRHLGATFVTSFFLHGGWFHLGSNLWFLLVFGDNTEDALGRWRYLAMIAAGHLAGTVAELLVPGSGAIPRVGASAGISAVVAFYALKFPHARLGMLFRYFYSLRWVTFSARTGFFLWVALQVVGAVFEFQGLGGVAHLAHLGGAAAGLAWWWWDEERHSAGTLDPGAST